MTYLVHFDLVEDLQHPGCPLCRAGDRTARGYVRSLMATDITDATVCDQLRRTGGLCRHHLLLAVNVARTDGDAMGLALLEELLLDIGRESVVSAHPHRRRHLRAERRARCLACESETVIVKGYADLLVSDPQQYLPPTCSADGRGLCLPHVLVVLNRPGDASARATIRDAWLATADRLGIEIDNSIGQHRVDRRQPATTSADEPIWGPIPAWLAGWGRRGER